MDEKDTFQIQLILPFPKVAAWTKKVMIERQNSGSGGGEWMAPPEVFTIVSKMQINPFCNTSTIIVIETFSESFMMIWRHIGKWRHILGYDQGL